MRRAGVAMLMALVACVHTQTPETKATDGRFKMVHQVAATFDGKQHVLTGYLLAKPDGSFRVSAAASMGPRLFDIARVNGEWLAKVHLKQLEGKLEPKYLGQAIDRVYFRSCPGTERCAMTGDEETDALEVERSNGDVTKKKFLQLGKPVIEITYSDYEAFPDGSRQARQIEIQHAKYQIVIALEQYEPNFGFDDAMLTP